MKNASAIAVLLPLLLGGCANMQPTLGDPAAKTVATGSAGGATAQNASSQLERCDKTLGTLAIVEEANQPWLHQLTAEYRIQSTVPLLRLIIQQSNCFVIVERGKAFNNMQGERELMQSGELRKNSNLGKGMMVAADYTATPSVSFTAQGTRGLGGLVGGRIGVVASLIGGSMKSNEASAMLLLTDNRSGIQLAAAEGSASNWDFGVVERAVQRRRRGRRRLLENPARQGADGRLHRTAYNQMVKAVRNYKAQSVEGGLGTGGVLKTN